MHRYCLSPYFLVALMLLVGCGGGSSAPTITVPRADLALRLMTVEPTTGTLNDSFTAIIAALLVNDGTARSGSGSVLLIAKYPDGTESIKLTQAIGAMDPGETEFVSFTIVFPEGSPERSTGFFGDVILRASFPSTIEASTANNSVSQSVTWFPEGDPITKPSADG